MSNLVVVREAGRVHFHARRLGTYQAAIAVDASCTHMYAPGVRRHIRKALDLGATQEEIAAVLQCVSVLGIHSVALGVPILAEESAALARRTPRD